MTIKTVEEVREPQVSFKEVKLRTYAVMRKKEVKQMLKKMRGKEDTDMAVFYFEATKVYWDKRLDSIQIGLREGVGADPRL